MTVDYKKVYQALSELTIPRHTWDEYQGRCHKRGCSCQNTMSMGRPEEALGLFISCAMNAIRTVELYGQTPNEVDEENYLAELAEDESVKR